MVAILTGIFGPEHLTLAEDVVQENAAPEKVELAPTTAARPMPAPVVETLRSEFVGEPSVKKLLEKFVAKGDSDADSTR